MAKKASAKKNQEVGEPQGDIEEAKEDAAPQEDAASSLNTQTVVIQKAIAGLDFSYHPGQLVELPAELAAKWIKSGVAADYQPVSEA